MDESVEHTPGIEENKWNDKKLMWNRVGILILCTRGVGKKCVGGVGGGFGFIILTESKTRFSKGIWHLSHVKGGNDTTISIANWAPARNEGPRHLCMKIAFEMKLIYMNQFKMIKILGVHFHTFFSLYFFDFFPYILFLKTFHPPPPVYLVSI